MRAKVRSLVTTRERKRDGTSAVLGQNRDRDAYSVPFPFPGDDSILTHMSEFEKHYTSGPSTRDNFVPNDRHRVQSMAILRHDSGSQHKP